MKKLLLLPLLALGLASTAFAGSSCGGSCSPAADKPACKCGATTADACHKHCGDKCDCTTPQPDAPKPEPKK